MNQLLYTNPSITFFKNHENNILKTRESLFSELDYISSDFGNEARNILKSKLESNNNTPLLGELFPWIIKDLVNADKEVTHKISVGWLGIYLYSLFLDEHVDNPKPLTSKQFIAGSLLAKTGILKISRFTNNTSYENLIDAAFSHSAKNQEFDSRFQKEETDINFKEMYSEGKNHIVLVCAGALAAQNSLHGEFIINFTKSLLLTLQYLDDISDYKEDFDARNFTVLLTEAFRNRPEFLNSVKIISSRDLLNELVQTGALQRVVEKIQVLLNQSMVFISQNKNYNQSEGNGVYEFFITLSAYTTSLNNYLKSNQVPFNTFPPEQKSAILDKVESYITKIAQST